MRAVVQRVSQATVTVAGVDTGRIGRGFLVLLGIEAGDTDADRAWLVGKIAGLRILDDEKGRMNLALADIGGEALVVSQFTLLATCRRGFRPGFTRAETPTVAREQYERFATELAAAIGRPIPTGVFGAMMQVSLVNEGPVTIVLDSRLRE